MNSKTKGNIGQATLFRQFVARGIQVSIPFGDNARYDLVIQLNGQLKKVQVKYCNQKIVNGSVCVPCASSTNHTTNKRYDTYVDDVDYIACYIPQWNKTCVIPIQQTNNQKAVYLRLQETKSGQKKKTRFVDDYSIDKLLCVETIHDGPKSKDMVKTQPGPQCESNAVK